MIAKALRPLRRTTRTRRAGGRAAVVLPVATALVVASAGVAHASLWAHQDGFELDPTTTWSIEHYGNSNGGFDLGVGTARSGSNDAWLTAQDQFSAVGKPVHLTPAEFHAATCSAQIYVKAVGPATLNVEVIEPASWTYIALNTVSLSGGGYTAVGVGPWTPGPVDVYFRVSLLGNGGRSQVRVDDLQVSCAY